MGGNTQFFWNRLSSQAGFEEVTPRVGLDGFDGTGLLSFDMHGDRDLAQVSIHGVRLFEDGHVASLVDVRIQWPDGRSRVLRDVAPNQMLTVLSP